MPYSHYHDWSFHTHHRRPKGGNHYRAVRRRQRPWRIGFWLVLVAGLVGIGWGVSAHDLLPVARTVIETSVAEVQADRRERTATRTVQGEIDRQTRVAAAAAQEEATISQLERKVHEGINAERVSNGGFALEWDGALAALARAHSDDMTKRGYFSHATPEGLDQTDRLHRAGLSCRKGFRYGIAENLTIETSLGNSDRTASEAVRGWMNSFGHRRNLLNGAYTTTGIGASFGTWRGYKAVYLTQVFC